MARRLAPDRARQFAATSDCHFQFQKRSQLFIRAHNETFSVAAMRVSNAIDYAKFRSRSHGAVIRVYDEAGNVIETHEHAGDFKEP